MNVRSAGNLKDIKKSKFLMITDMFLLMRHIDLEMRKQRPMKSYTIYALEKNNIIIRNTFNNYFTDILSLLKLFQRPNRSNIPGIRNLTNFFKPLQKKVNDAKKEIKDEYIKVVKYCSTKIRENIFKHVMVRRTRKEIKKYFSKDINKQGLSFPEVAPPIALGYEFGDKIDNIFHETIDLIKNNFKKLDICLTFI